MKLRILSDLHLGHPASLLTAPDQLEPLLEGVGTLVFNGDTFEARSKRFNDLGRGRFEQLCACCREAGTEPIFITGNHDPQISALGHLDLGDGAILVTHGDLLFHGLSPWSREAKRLAKAHQEELLALEDEAFHDFEKRLSASKRAALAIELHDVALPQGFIGRIGTVLREIWPIWRPLQIIKIWIETPDRAVDLARVFRSRARFIIIGHTHYSGVWRRGPRVVINTGSFLAGGRRMAVDLTESEVIVRKIVSQSGRFHPGPEVHRFPISKLKAHEGF